MAGISVSVALEAVRRGEIIRKGREGTRAFLMKMVMDHRAYAKSERKH